MMIIWILGFLGSFTIQTAFQSWFADNSYWGANHGWQNEIAIWNLGVLIVLLGIFKANSGVERSVLPGLAVLSLCFGANHALALSSSPESISNWAGATMNGLAVLLYAFYLFMNGKADSANTRVNSPGSSTHDSK